MYPSAKVRAVIFAGAAAVTCSVALVCSQYEWFDPPRKNKYAQLQHTTRSPENLSDNGNSVGHSATNGESPLPTGDPNSKSTVPVGIAAAVLNSNGDNRETHGSSHIIFQRSVRYDCSLPPCAGIEKKVSPELLMIEICPMVDISPQPMHIHVQQPASGERTSSQLSHAKTMLIEPSQSSSMPQTEPVELQNEPTSSATLTSCEGSPIKEEFQPSGELVKTVRREGESDSYVCTACGSSLTSQKLQKLKSRARDPLPQSSPRSEQETQVAAQSVKLCTNPDPNHPSPSPGGQPAAESLKGDAKKTEALRNSPAVECIKSTAEKVEGQNPMPEEDYLKAMDSSSPGNDGKHGSLDSVQKQTLSPKKTATVHSDAANSTDLKSTEPATDCDSSSSQKPALGVEVRTPSADEAVSELEVQDNATKLQRENGTALLHDPPNGEQSGPTQTHHGKSASTGQSEPLQDPSPDDEVTAVSSTNPAPKKSRRRNDGAGRSGNSMHASIRIRRRKRAMKRNGATGN